MKFKGKKMAALNRNIAIIIIMIGLSIIIGIAIHGAKLFSSFAYFIKYVSFGWAYGFSFWLGHVAINTYIVKKLDWTKNLKKANIISLLSYIIYGIIICVTIPLIYDLYIWGMSSKEALIIDVLIKTFMVLTLDLIVIASFYSTYLTKYWKKAIEKNEELKRENLLAKYEALKNQVNPHFLFNNLNTLSGMVEQKHELATDFIKKLSDIYRYVLEQTDTEMVSIKDEIKFVTDYVFLSKMRFGKGLIFNSHITNDRYVQVVPLGIQMLVENAIKHNIISDDMPLKIEMELDGDFVIVKNNLQKKNTINRGKEPLGLENIKKRYAYLSDVPVEVIESDSKFIVKLPVVEA